MTSHQAQPWAHLGLHNHMQRCQDQAHQHQQQEQEQEQQQQPYIPSMACTHPIQPSTTH